MKIEGKLHAKFDTQQIKDTFRKRELVVEFKENPLYPQMIKFELIQDKCDLLDAFNVGDQIEVTFNLKGREWVKPDGEKVYFTTLDAWRLQKAMDGASSGEEGNAEKPVYDLADVAAEDPDDLPF